MTVASPTAPASPNPLLAEARLPRFAEIQPAHVEPAIRQLLSEGRAHVEAIAALRPPSFATVVVPLEEMRHRLARTWSPVSHLNAVMALPYTNASAEQVRYASGVDLLRHTPGFVADTRAKRLDGEFNAAYRYLEILFDGRNPYMESIDRNLQFLAQVLRSESWRMLRRNPPLYAADPDTLEQVRGQMLGYFKRAWLRD